MRRTQIKKIATASFTKQKLDEVKVKRVAKQLKRQDLKIYIRELKDIESKKTVQITVSSEEGLLEMKKYFTKLYPDKKLLFSIDDTLIGGIRVVDYDNIYELSIKNFLEGSVEGGLND